MLKVYKTTVVVANWALMSGTNCQVIRIYSNYLKIAFWVPLNILSPNRMQLNTFSKKQYRIVVNILPRIYEKFTPKLFQLIYSSLILNTNRYWGDAYEKKKIIIKANRQQSQWLSINKLIWFEIKEMKRKKRHILIRIYIFQWVSFKLRIIRKDLALKNLIGK